MLTRPEVHSWRQYSFAGSITLVFASGVGLCPGQPQLRGERRFERRRRGTDDQGRAARARNGGTGGRLRRPGQGEARGTSPRATLSSLAERLNDGRLPDGEVVANLESEIRKLCEVGGRRFRVALLPTEIRASREPGLRLNPQLGRIPAKIRAELTSAEIAMSGSYFDDVLLSMTCCAIRGATTLRTPPTKCAGRALFDEDATPCAPSVSSATIRKLWLRSGISGGSAHVQRVEAAVRYPLDQVTLRDSIGDYVTTTRAATARLFV